MKKSLIITLLVTIFLLTAIKSLEPEHPGRYSLHLIQPGDTLADISSQYMPDIDPLVGAQSVSRGESRDLVMEATAYTAGPESTGKSPGHPEYGITRSGLPADAGVVAVDPAVIPIGSTVWIEGYGYALALDTGSAIEGYKIDVFFWDLETALKWGRKKVRVKIIDF